MFGGIVEDHASPGVPSAQTHRPGVVVLVKEVLDGMLFMPRRAVAVACGRCVGTLAVGAGEGLPFLACEHG